MKIIVDSEEQKQRILDESEYIHYFLEDIEFIADNGQKFERYVGLDSDKCGLLMHLYMNPNIIEVKL